MASGFHGDMNKLFELVQQMRSVGGDAFIEKVNRTLAESAIREVRAGFRGSRDPYGKSWKGLATARGRNAKKGDTGKPLVDTGRLRASFTYSDVSSRGFRIGSNVEYAPVHQHGSKKKNIPARNMVPTETQGLGPIWLRSFRTVINRRVRELFKR